MFQNKEYTLIQELFGKLNDYSPQFLSHPQPKNGMHSATDVL